MEIIMKNDLEQYLIKKLKRVEDKLEHLNDYNGWVEGYYEGKLSLLEDILDEYCQDWDD